MSSIYHILDKTPAIYEEDMPSEYESLAKQLINSGRLRIDTDYYCNFSRYTESHIGINLIFSKEELFDSKLITLTKSRINRLYTQKGRDISETQINKIIDELKNQVSRLLPVSDELRMQLARIFVQSAHPIAIKWLLIDHVQIFITYSHNIGDVMDIQTWKTSGSNSGMQSTDGSNVCIYVSCGGDPFAKNDDNYPTYGDGWAAIARMQVIAAQEIGHFADIKRDHTGRQITRHSANFACTKPSTHVKIARKNDIDRCNELLNNLMLNGMTELLLEEEKLKFYDKQKISGLKVIWIRLLIKYYKYKFLKFADRKNMHFIKRFKKDRYMAILIKAMILDMKANLSPVAEVYKRDNKEAEEAISCAEALARVPQQVIKWGHLTTKTAMHDLYKIYYNEVITSLIEAHNHVTGKHYKRNYSHHKYTLWQRIMRIIKTLRIKNRIKLQPIRDL